MPHITTLNRDTINDYQFKEEFKALARKVKSKTETRPVVITVQVGETRWVWNGDEPLPA